MKTLLVYYSNNKNVQELCEASGKRGEVDVVRLQERYEKSVIWNATIGTYRAISGMGSKIADFDVNLSEYDSLIIATPVRIFNPHSVINEFLHRTCLSGIDVSALLVHNGKIIGGAGDVLRKRIGLAGGNCRGIVSISTQELKKKGCDVFSLAKINSKISVKS